MFSPKPSQDVLVKIINKQFPFIIRHYGIGAEPGFFHLTLTVTIQEAVSLQYNTDE